MCEVYCNTRRGSYGGIRAAKPSKPEPAASLTGPLAFRGSKLMVSLLQYFSIDGSIPAPAWANPDMPLHLDVSSFLAADTVQRQMSELTFV